MRWDDLFADLDAQADALELAERAAEIGERARIEIARLALLDRLRAALDTTLRLELAGGVALTGTVQRVGVDWLLLDEGAGREALVALPAVQTVLGLGRLSAVPGSGGQVLARLTLRSALRGIARDRSGVQLHLTGGGVVAATIDRVGADFLEVARHAVGEARRRSEVRDVVLVPFTAVTAVRRQAG